MIEGSALPPRVKERSRRVFMALAHAEGAVHERDPETVHFHEVGGHDAIVDIVGTVLALELLDVDAVFSGPVAMGIGTVRSAHGVLPNPAPAVLELLRGAPILGTGIELELTTPTGAALLSSLAAGFGAIPPMTIESAGYGAGSREIDGLPNATQVVIGSTERADDSTAGATRGEPLVLVETNLDDATGEQVADVMTALFGAGVADAWITPVVMKKGRPGQIVSALCAVSMVSVVREILFTEGGTFGVRTHGVERYASSRETVVVRVGDLPVRIKVSRTRAKPEHDDAVSVARALGRPVRDVIDDAQRAYRDLVRTVSDERT
jgi:uncharacterized protein (TIGR00299 family) protein